MPCTTKRVTLAGITNSYTDAAVCRHSFENDLEGGKGQWLSCEVTRFDDCYEDNNKGEPPDIVAELKAKLFVHEAAARKAREARVRLVLLRLFRGPVIRILCAATICQTAILISNTGKSHT